MLGFPTLYFKAMRLMMFQPYGFYYRVFGLRVLGLRGFFGSLANKACLRVQD